MHRHAKSAAIYYQSEAYSTGGQKLMGRQAAGESLLRGLAAYSSITEMWAYVERPEDGRSFAAVVGRPVKLIGKENAAALAQAGVLYFPGPNLGQLAWQRALFGHGDWSLCGITHTTSSARAMDGIADLLTAPVQPWDALICTSIAVKDNVEKVLQAQADYLQARLGICKLVLPQLPVIPLGIHTEDFRCTGEQRAAARAAIDADERTLVVLFMGRLSFHAKAHPLAMYQALEKAVCQLPQDSKVVLVECGWFAHESIATAFDEAAGTACPRVRVMRLDGRKPEERQIAWACADVFCSLSDNIQETFGIVPIEAMAAGLPVVVADWDGYRDTVRDGVDGFRIPTLMPPAGLGADLAARHALGIDSYDLYCGYASSLVAVDVEAASQAFVRLFNSPELRREMGAAGRQRAGELYDWRVIIPRYEALWQELDGLRKAQAPQLAPLAVPWAARMDPLRAFSGYPTATLQPQTLLELADGGVETALQRLAGLRELSMVSFAGIVAPNQQETRIVLTGLSQGPSTAEALLTLVPAERRPYVFRGLAWLLKLGVLKICVE